jgi:hypothetical protein
MKVTICLVLLFVAIHARPQQRLPDTSKYRIVLPTYWSTGNGVWTILTDALPVACPQLAGKQLCVSTCNAAYNVVLRTSKPEVVNRTYSVSSSSATGDEYTIRDYYQFTAALWLEDADGKRLVKMILVDTDEVFSVSSTVTIERPTMQPPPRPAPRSRAPEVNTLQQWESRIVNSPTRTIMDYMNKPFHEIQVSEYEVYKIINSKLFALKQ